MTREKLAFDDRRSYLIATLVSKIVAATGAVVSECSNGPEWGEQLIMNILAEAGGVARDWPHAKRLIVVAFRHCLAELEAQDTAAKPQCGG